MSANGEAPGKLSVGQRLDPGRVQQLEQQAALQSQLLVARALSDVSNLANALHFLTEQAGNGNTAARQTLKLYFDNLERARAALVGITVPGA